MYVYVWVYGLGRHKSLQFNQFCFFLFLTFAFLFWCLLCFFLVFCFVLLVYVCSLGRHKSLQSNQFCFANNKCHGQLLQRKFSIWIKEAQKQKEKENVREGNLEFTAYNPFLHNYIIMCEYILKRIDMRSSGEKRSQCFYNLFVRREMKSLSFLFLQYHMHI